MKKNIIVLWVALLTALILLLVFQYAKWNYNAHIDALQSQTISWQLEQVRAEARTLEKEKADYEQKKIDEKLNALYTKSATLQSLLTTGDNWKLKQ